MPCELGDFTDAQEAISRHTGEGRYPGLSRIPAFRWKTAIGRFEVHDSIEVAVRREKQIKEWRAPYPSI